MKEPLLMSDEEKFRVGTIKQHKEAHQLVIAQWRAPWRQSALAEVAVMIFT
jgi:hypothetical protein